MKVYLGGPIDNRDTEEGWKQWMTEWLAKFDHTAYDPEIFGKRALSYGVGSHAVWAETDFERSQCDLAIYHWSLTSVGTHMEMDRSRHENQEFFVWDLSPEEADSRVALWGVKERTALTLSKCLQDFVIPFLSRGDVSLAEVMTEMLGTIYLSRVQSISARSSLLS